MKSYKQPILLSGESNIVEKFEHYDSLNLGKKQACFFAECRTVEHLGQTDSVIKKASLEDVEEIINLRNTIEEFPFRSDAREILIRSMKSNTSRTYFTDEFNVITSSVLTTAENTKSAMIVGVCTRRIASYKQLI